MKFLVFLTFVATISATTVNISSDANCDEFNESCEECRIIHNLRSDDVTSALITDNKAGVVFYENEGCTGKEYEVIGPVLGEKCYDLKALFDFEPRCIGIFCGDSEEVSCHIVTVVLWSILTRFDIVLVGLPY